MSEENVEIMRGIYDEMARGNFWALGPFLDPRVEWIWPAAYQRIVGEKVYRGLTGVEAATREWFEAWESYTLSAEELIDVGDSVVVLSHAHAVPKRGGVGLEQRGAEVWTLRGGKVVRMHGFSDRDEALQAAGLSEQAMSQENVEQVEWMTEAFKVGDAHRCPRAHSTPRLRGT